jgi:cytidyltransferase-like protein
MKIVLVTGGFDPIHSGHIEYLKSAKQLGDQLYVGLNSDNWLARKKGQPFMPYSERLAVLSSLRYVDHVFPFNDEDGSACNAIRQLLEDQTIEIIFANGGDRTLNNIPEMSITDPRLGFVFGVGGENKKNSSSWILREWTQPKTYRDWGYYRVLYDIPGCKVKELTVDPGKKLSMQRHNNRSEYWLVSSGKCDVSSELPTGYALPTITLEEHEAQVIPKQEWHQLSNPYSEPCKIVEIQYGTSCVEEDIERKKND